MAADVSGDARAGLLGRSEHLRIRGLRYHVRRWGSRDAPCLFLLHGFLDVSGTFSIVAARLAREWQVLAPDWRGFGYTEWPADGYWFADYIGDLDALVRHYSPDAPVAVAGHSMGSQIGALFAGARPERVSRLALIDGLGLRNAPAAQLPSRMATWLDELQKTSAPPTYASFAALAERIRLRHTRLSAERALWVAHLWGREDGFGRVSLCADPRHMRNMPALYRVEESEAAWSAIQAPTLLLFAGASELRQWFDDDELARRCAFFRQHRVVWLPDYGHMLHLEAPEALSDVLCEFFARS